MRRARKVHLTAPSEELVRSGAVVLEEAMRTASLPDADGPYLVVIRRLDVGRIHVGAGHQALSHVIARRVGELRASAVDATAPGAKAARCVRFADEVEAATLLALCVARGEPADAWYWPLAVRGHRPSAPRGDALRGIVAHVARSPAGASAMAALVDALRRGGGLDALLAATGEDDARAWLGEVGLALPAGPAEAPRGPPRALPDVGPFRAVIARCASRFGPDDARSRWLAVMALVADNPRLAHDPALPTRAAALAGRAVVEAQGHVAGPARPAEVPHHRGPEGGAPTPSRPLAGPGIEPARPSLPGGRSAEPTPARSRPVIVGHQTISSRPDDPAADTSDAPAREAPASHASHASHASAFGGLLFLVPIVTRLGLPALLAREPRWLDEALPDRLLLHIARSLGAPDDDAMLRCLLPSPEAPLSDDGRALCAAWHVAVRRHCRRVVRRGLASVVRRPARVIATRTHLDVCFDLRLVDLAVRRTGLDIDPGWVPWLGRVVRFHYLDRSELDGL